MAELDARQRAPFVDAVGHVAVIDDVALVIKGRDRGHRLVRLRMDHAGFGAKCRPAAFCLHLPMHGVGARPGTAGAGALRHLEEPVLQGFRADGDRLEEDIVAGISRHLRSTFAIRNPFFASAHRLTSEDTGRVDRCLEGRVAAIDHMDAAGHRARLVGRQEDRESRDFLGIHDAHQVQRLDRSAFDRVVEEHALMRRLDEARTYGVDPHAFGRKPGRHGARHRYDAALGGCIGIEPGLADQRIDRRRQDDRARRCFKHLRRDVFRGEEGSGQHQTDDLRARSPPAIR